MKKSRTKRVLKGGLVGLWVGVAIFIIAIIALTTCEQTVTQGISENVFIILTYVPLKVFSHYVDKGLINKHDAVAAATFVGIWFCVISSVLGSTIAFLLPITKNKNRSDNI